MSELEIRTWVTPSIGRNWTHVIGGSFIDPQRSTQGATDLFCYDQNAGYGMLFATVKNGQLNNGVFVPDGAYQIGGTHTFDRRWTHLVGGFFSGGSQLLFYDASTGVGEFYTVDEQGHLNLKKHYSGWRTSWTHIISGSFGKANLLFYDAASGAGEFYFVDNSANLHLVRSHGWSTGWTLIIAGLFSSTAQHDLLFYNKAAGSGEFYKVNDNGDISQYSEHDNWRNTWRHIVPGRFSLNPVADGLLFYEEGTGHTEIYSTNGKGEISNVDAVLGNEWSLPWQTILSGLFTPNIGLTESSLCAYDVTDGVLRYLYFGLFTIKSVIELNGQWTDGTARRINISVASTSLQVDMSAYNRPAAHGTIVDATTITVTFPDDATYTGTLQPPNRINWLNGSAWVKV